MDLRNQSSQAIEKLYLHSFGSIWLPENLTHGVLTNDRSPVFLWLSIGFHGAVHTHSQVPAQKIWADLVG